MKDPQQPNPVVSGQPPSVVRRTSRSRTASLLIIVGLFICVVVMWRFLNPREPIQKMERNSLETTTQTSSVEARKPSSWDEKLSAALYAARMANRDEAHKLFQDLLIASAEFSDDDPRVVALLPRAATFYAKGKELSQEEVEQLYLDAIDAIKKTHGPDYYDWENVHTGLGRLYESMGRYQEAAIQTRELLKFWRRKITNHDERYNLITPTLVRLGDNYTAAQQYQEARDAYETALEMIKARGNGTGLDNTKFIKERLAKLAKKAGQAP